MKLYINLTNFCICNCPDCCFNSNIKATPRFLDVNKLHSIMANAITEYHKLQEKQEQNNEELIVYLECCDILSYPFSLTILAYLMSLPEVNKIYIQVGVNIDKFRNMLLKDILDMAAIFNKIVGFNFIVNKYIAQSLDRCIPALDNKEARIIQSMHDLWKQIISCIYFIISKNNVEYTIYAYAYNLNDYVFINHAQHQCIPLIFDVKLNTPIIDIQDKNWCCYASDGTNFGKDIIKRKEYEYLRR